MNGDQNRRGVPVVRLIGYWLEQLPDQAFPGATPQQAAAYQQTREAGLRWPDPESMVDEGWDPAERSLVTRHLESGTLVNHYRGLSNCRFCDAYNGSAEMTDGIYCWPEGLAHYVRAHNVKLPEEFLAHVHGEVERVDGLPYANFEDLGQRDRSWPGTELAWELWNASPVPEGGYADADPTWWLAHTQSRS